MKREKIVKVDDRIKKIGPDGQQLVISNFSGGRNHIYYDLQGRKKMNKINVPYSKNSDECFSVSMKDDKNGYGLLIDICLSKFQDFHNLYFSTVEESLKLVKILKKKLKKLGFITKIKKYEILDIEVGMNIVDTDISLEQKSLFRHIASGLNDKYKIYSSSNGKPYLDEDSIENKNGFSALKGFDRFKIYCKTTQLIKKSNITIDKNITRMEIKLSGKELLKRLGTNNLLKVYKFIMLVFEEKMDEAFKKIDKNNEHFKKFLIREIRAFKRKGKQGLVKHILRFNFICEKTVLDVITMMNKELNYHGARYKKQIKNKRKKDMDKLAYIKEELSIFFHSINSKLEWKEKYTKLSELLNKYSLEEIEEEVRKLRKKRRVKSGEYFLNLSSQIPIER